MLPCLLITRFIAPRLPHTSTRGIHLSGRFNATKRLAQKLQMLSEKSEKEKTAITRRMLEFVFGKRTATPKTRSQKLVEYVVLVVTASLYWYWLSKVRRYRIDTMLEMGLLEYDKKGKPVDTDTYIEAGESSPTIIGAVAFRLRDKFDQLEKEVQEFKKEREWLREVLEKQKLIDSKLDSLERKLDSKS